MVEQTKEVKEGGTTKISPIELALYGGLFFGENRGLIFTISFHFILYHIVFYLSSILFAKADMESAPTVYIIN